MMRAINSLLAVTAMTRRRRLTLALALGGLLIAGSTAVLSRSTLAVWFGLAAGTSSNEAIVSTAAPANSRTLIPTTRSNRGHDTRLLYSFALPLLVLNAPTNLGVTAASHTQISLTWTAPGGTVDHYQIESSTSLSGPFTLLGTSSTTIFSYAPPSGIHSYLYRVRAVDGFGAPSAPSNMALGTSIDFTDPTLYANVTEVKAQHIYDLRNAIDAVRGLVPSLSTVTWTPSQLEQVTIHATDVQDLREKLGDALSALSISSGAYEDSTLATGANGTLIKKIHIEQLRERSTKGSSTSSGPADNSNGGSSMARLDPLNRTGGGGEDPLSRNYNWSVSLLSLPGRAGLDLGLSLSYNSLVWTKSGDYISFNDDGGFPSPGFRLGFPVIQQFFINAQGSKSYLMITPAGARVELRQVGTSSLYQAVDSSYLLLDSANMTLHATDGTQLSYAWKGSDYECTQIKDRNGNFITINYTLSGHIDTVVDTLSRTITFHYDANDSLTTITQTWAGQTEPHRWAAFEYTLNEVQTNFGSMNKIGPANGSTVRSLTRFTLNDNSRFDFDYTYWAQIWKINNLAADGHLLNYRAYNLPGDANTAWDDCPRFTRRVDWAENFNLDSNSTAQEVATQFAVPVDAALPDNSLAIVARTQVTMPDGTSQKIYFGGNVAGGAGSAPMWERGLPLLSETYEGSTVQRAVTTGWEQDDENAAYQLNPRVKETNITDPAGNHARTRVEYTATNLSDGTTVNLPVNTYEYQADASTVLRRTHVVYNMATDYINRRIIGLVSEQYLYEGPTGSETLMSKVTYDYDGSGSIQGTDAPVQHDNANFTASFRVGRGNMSSVTRHDVSTDAPLTSTMQYNTAGSVVATRDPLNHGVNISYADQFSVNGTDLDSALSFSTLAYPTQVTDAGGFISNTRYNYAFGGTTWKRTPLPNVTSNADPASRPVQIVEYDPLGHVQKVQNLINNAYTRYEYPTSQIRVDTYATIKDNAGEAHSFRITDGHGRVIGSAADHPGSTGGYSGQRIYYDVMGRVAKQSNPTETSASGVNPYNWTATGDDATNGWLYTQQTYDWKGRPLVTTNPDTTFKSASYGGCGCAGGQVVTLTDEVSRQQKIYSDVLGRQLKTEILNLNSSTVYSTTRNSFNARDQVTLVRQYQGDDQSSTYQDTTMSYDGYGRLQAKHVPEQQVDPNNSSSTDHTAWSYHDDDGTIVVTDARGASATYGYNSRGLVSGVTYSGPSGISMPTAIGYVYDAAGNRISMSDGTGNTNYEYDALSRLTSESKQFAGLNSTYYALTYGYNLANELTSMSIPFSSQGIGYGYDGAGRLSSVSASNFSATYGSSTQSITSFASNISYRAWGGRKDMTYGNTTSDSITYNQRLQPASYTLNNVNYQNTNVPSSPVNYTSMSWSYDYYNDGQLHHAYDSTNNWFDRAYAYDHVGRLTEATTYRRAEGLSPALAPDPYQQTTSYDVWNNSSRTGYLYDGGPFGDDGAYVNNRHHEWGYDADGNVTNSFTYHNTIDAAGKQAHVVSGLQSVGDGTAQFPTQPAIDITQGYDGDGRPRSRVQIARQNIYDDTNQNHPLVQVLEDSQASYYATSSVLGGANVMELRPDGQGGAIKKTLWVYAGGQRIAVEENGSVNFEHHNPATGSWVTTLGHPSDRTATREERDPVGAETPTSNPYPLTPNYVENKWGEPLFIDGGDPFDYSSGQTIDGLPVSSSEFNRRMEAGIVSKESLVNTGGRLKTVTDHIEPLGLGLFSSFRYYDNDNGDTVAQQFFFTLPQKTKRRGTKKPKTQPQKKSACERFAEELASRLWATVVEDGGFNPDSRNELARDMVLQAYRDTDFNGYRYEKKRYPIDGFKLALTTYGQDADVYHHILFTAGNALHGTVAADAENWAFRRYDQHQAASGRQESIAELADDDAGMEVGQRMLDTALAGRSGDYWGLKDKIKSILCAY